MYKLSDGTIKIVDTKSSETKELIRVSRHNKEKRGDSSIIEEKESVEYAPLKNSCVIVKFTEMVKGGTVTAGKGYVSREFAEEMKKRDVIFIAIKRKNVIKRK